MYIDNMNVKNQGDKIIFNLECMNDFNVKKELFFIVDKAQYNEEELSLNMRMLMDAFIFGVEFNLKHEDGINYICSLNGQDEVMIKGNVFHIID